MKLCSFFRSSGSEVHIGHQCSYRNLGVRRAHVDSRNNLYVEDHHLVHQLLTSTCMTMFLTHSITPTSSVDGQPLLSPHNLPYISPHCAFLGQPRDPGKFRTFAIGLRLSHKMNMSPPVFRSSIWHSVAADVHIHVGCSTQRPLR
jgi:hypothetical protein